MLPAPATGGSDAHDLVRAFTVDPNRLGVICWLETACGGLLLVELGLFFQPALDVNEVGRDDCRGNMDCPLLLA